MPLPLLLLGGAGAGALIGGAFELWRQAARREAARREAAPPPAPPSRGGTPPPRWEGIPGTTGPGALPGMGPSPSISLLQALPPVDIERMRLLPGQVPGDGGGGGGLGELAGMDQTADNPYSPGTIEQGILAAMLGGGGGVGGGGGGGIRGPQDLLAGRRGASPFDVSGNRAANAESLAALRGSRQGPPQGRLAQMLGEMSGRLPASDMAEMPMMLRANNAIAGWPLPPAARPRPGITTPGRSLTPPPDDVFSPDPLGRQDDAIRRAEEALAQILGR